MSLIAGGAGRPGQSAAPASVVSFAAGPPSAVSGAGGLKGSQSNFYQDRKRAQSAHVSSPNAKSNSKNRPIFGDRRSEASPHKREESYVQGLEVSREQWEMIKAMSKKEEEERQARILSAASRAAEKSEKAMKKVDNPLKKTKSRISLMVEDEDDEDDESQNGINQNKNGFKSNGSGSSSNSGDETSFDDIPDSEDTKIDSSSHLKLKPVPNDRKTHEPKRVLVGRRLIIQKWVKVVIFLSLIVIWFWQSMIVSVISLGQNNFTYHLLLKLAYFLNLSWFMLANPIYFDKFRIKRYKSIYHVPGMDGDEGRLEIVEDDKPGHKKNSKDRLDLRKQSYERGKSMSTQDEDGMANGGNKDGNDDEGQESPHFCKRGCLCLTKTQARTILLVAYYILAIGWTLNQFYTFGISGKQINFSQHGRLFVIPLFPTLVFMGHCFSFYPHLFVLYSILTWILITLAIGLAICLQTILIYLGICLGGLLIALLISMFMKVGLENRRKSLEQKRTRDHRSVSIIIGGRSRKEKLLENHESALYNDDGSKKPGRRGRGGSMGGAAAAGRQHAMSLLKQGMSKSARNLFTGGSKADESPKDEVIFHMDDDHIHRHSNGSRPRDIKLAIDDSIPNSMDMNPAIASHQAGGGAGDSTGHNNSQIPMLSMDPSNDPSSIPLEINAGVGNPAGQGNVEQDDLGGYLELFGLADEDFLSWKRVTEVNLCCDHLVINVKDWYKFQSVLSGLSFWPLFGLIFTNTLNDDWIVLALLFFTMTTTWFNSAYYSSFRQNLRSKFMQFSFNFYYFCGMFLGLFQFFLSMVFWLSASGTSIQETSNVNLSVIKKGFNANGGFYVLIVPLIAGFGWYFPSTGYLFYRSPIWFGGSHLAFALLGMIAPLLIASSKTTQLAASIVVFAAFLSVSGFSCTYFRYKKSIIRSQAQFTGKMKGQDIQTYNVSLIMAFSLLFSFGDIASDFAYAFIAPASTFHQSVRLICQGLFIFQAFVSFASMIAAISTLKKQLRSTEEAQRRSKINSSVYTHQKIKEKLVDLCGCTLLYPLIMVFWYIGLILFSILLGLTKLMAIQQIEHWWLGLWIANYKSRIEEQQSRRARHMAHQKEIERQVLEQKANDKEMMNQFLKENAQAGRGFDEFDEKYIQDVLKEFLNDLDIDENVGNVNKFADLLDDEGNKRRNKNKVDKSHWKTRRGYLYDPDNPGLIMGFYLLTDKFTPKWIEKAIVNAFIYNTLQMSELIVESVPQLLLNLANLYLQNEGGKSGWNPIAATSLFFSASIVVYNVLKIVYWVGLKGKNLGNFLL